MNLTKFKLFLTRENIYIIILSTIVSVGLSLGIASLVGPSAETGDVNIEHKMVFQAFTDFYKGMKFAPVRDTLGMAALGGFIAIGISLWVLVWMVTKLRHIKRVNDSYVTGGDIFLMTMAVIVVLGISIGAIICSHNIGNPAWWAMQKANGFEGFVISI